MSVQNITQDSGRLFGAQGAGAVFGNVSSTQSAAMLGVNGLWELDMHFRVGLVVMEARVREDQRRLEQLPPPGFAPVGGLQTKGNVVTTAGGYEIEAMGNSEVIIRDQEGKQVLRVWGDPHVDEGTGDIGRWDFTKDSVFVLEDGTRITFDTNYDNTSGTSQSVTVGLSITSADGAQTVGVTDAGGAQPVVHGINDEQSVAYQSQMNAQDRDELMDRFLIDNNTADKDGVDVYRIRNGISDGKIDDEAGDVRTDDDGVRIYDQAIESEEMPEDFSRGWAVRPRILTARDLTDGLVDVENGEQATRGGAYALDLVRTSEYVFDAHIRATGVGSTITGLSQGFHTSGSSHTMDAHGNQSMMAWSQGAALSVGGMIDILDAVFLQQLAVEAERQGQPNP